MTELNSTEIDTHVEIENDNIRYMSQHFAYISEQCIVSSNTRSMLCSALTSSIMWDGVLEKKLRGLSKIQSKTDLKAPHKRNLINKIAADIQKIRNVRMRDMTVLISLMHGLTFAVDKSNANQINDQPLTATPTVSL